MSSIGSKLIQKRRNQLSNTLSVLSKILVILSVIYGEIYAIIAFFKVDVCNGVSCRWVFSEWNPISVAVLFIVYLPISSLVSVIYAWPGYAVSAILFVIAERLAGDRESAKRATDSDQAALQKPLDSAEISKPIDNDRSASLRVADLWAKIGEYRLALLEYGQVLERSPNSAAAYFGRGDMYHRIGQYEHAIEDFDRSIDLKLGVAEVYEKRASAYYALAQYGEALRDYTQAIDLAPQSASAYYYRSLANLRTGDLGAACSDMRHVVKLESTIKPPNWFGDCP